MPETVESLSFDDHGVCSVCKQIDYKHTKIDWQERGVQLDALLEQHRGRRQYDCIVPFSGGKDSTFTLWYLVKQKKLKPLVVRFDHGFFRPRTQENVTRALRTLGVDCQQFTPNWQVVRKLMFEALRRRGDFCWHCHTGIFAYPMWIAVEQNIPLVIWGEPGAEYSSYTSYDEEEEADDRQFNVKINLGINAEDMLGMLDNTISDYPVTAHDLKPYTYPPIEDLRRKNVRSIFLGSYVPWDVRSQTEIIRRELGWKGDEVEGVPPEYDYEKVECFMQGVRDYIKFLKRGYGRTAHLVSIDIRNKRMDRERGEELAETFDGRRPAALDRFLEYLGIDEMTFMRLVEPHVVAPHKMPTLEDCHRNQVSAAPWDFHLWPRVLGARSEPPPKAS